MDAFTQSSTLLIEADRFESFSQNMKNTIINSYATKFKGDKYSIEEAKKSLIRQIEIEFTEYKRKNNKLISDREEERQRKEIEAKRRERERQEKEKQKLEEQRYEEEIQRRFEELVRDMAYYSLF